MTDNEIIKALECCTHNGDWNMVCSECPFSNSINCRVLLARNALSLINRQQAEIEGDKVIINRAANVRVNAIKEFAERLKANTCEFGSAKGIQREVDNLVKEMVGEDK